ncbi:D-alanyl-D-alanine carboxypeptidase/D-alanyl-D-alanine endopeptidase [Chitiniphilus shinanonensis]|uniref:D-alanyl-D-alanine carboxypeptidase/D-alanyl-D-alanine endopeptidase n=1 Tax=Chitiniphilus shinanonensis TaxID=553088 RepID=UPI003340FDB9
MKRSLMAWIGLMLLANGAQAETSLASPPSEVAAALRAAKVPVAALSLAVVPLASPQDGLYFNAEIPANPASVMKLVTTQVALEKLGPAYQWTTELYGDGPVVDGVLHGNLYLKGAGDPKLTFERVWVLLRDLRAAGIERVSGDLVLDRNALRLPPPNEFDDDEHDLARAFLVTPDALLAGFKAQRFRVSASQGKTRVVVEPPLAEVGVENAVRVAPSAPCTIGNLRFDGDGQGGPTRVRISGALPEGCSVERYLSYLEAPAYTAALVRSLWRELGGDLGGRTREGAVPSTATRLAANASPDLVGVIRDINKFSNNLMARQLFLSLGAAYRQPGEANDAVSAARVVREWLDENALSWPELSLENGSGLSRRERISARHLAQLLLRAEQGPYSAEFISSLPIVAVDGTMKRRLNGSGIAGAAHVKTGTLKDVRAVAGYVQAQDGRRYAVVGIVNHAAAPAAGPALDALLAWVGDGGWSKLARGGK